MKNTLSADLGILSHINLQCPFIIYSETESRKSLSDQLVRAEKQAVLTAVQHLFLLFIVLFPSLQLRQSKPLFIQKYALF